MDRILLVDNDAESLHRLRQESRRAGLSFVYESAREEAAVMKLLARGPAMVVAAVAGMGALSLRAVLEAAQKADVPAMVLGGDTEEEREQLFRLRGLYTALLRRSRRVWLPLLLERTLREHRGAHDQRRSQAEAHEQLERAAEQMREVQKLAVVGRLAGSIAHEINNPLESVTNLAYLLSADEALPAHLRPYLELAQQELDRAAQITKQTLSFYRETQEPVRVMLSDLLNEVLALYARRLREKQIELERRFESEEPLLLFPGEMRQVYANLLANAIEATSPGGRIVVRLHRARVRRPGQRDAVEGMRVVFADSGSGIPAEAKARLGQPFYTTKGQRGTGLGLWVSQSIIKRYKGEMQLRSSTGAECGMKWKGTTFSIFLPQNLRPRVVEIAPPGPRSSHEGASAAEGLRLRASSS